MGRHLAVANSFARKWFEPVDRANEFAPTRSLLFIEDRTAYGERIVHAVRAQLPDGAIVKRLVSLLPCSNQENIEELWA